MSFKEKIYITLVCFAVLCWRTFLAIATFPTAKGNWIIFTCVLGMIVPWVLREPSKAIRGKVEHIELWQIDKNGNLAKLVKSFDERKTDTIAKLFDVKLELIADTDYSDYALRVIYKKGIFRRKDTILYPHRNVVRYFIRNKSSKGAVLGAGSAAAVHMIIDEATQFE